MRSLFGAAFVGVVVLLSPSEAFSEDTALLIPQRNEKGKWGYGLSSKELKIPATFDLALPFSEGFGVVQDGKDFYYINEKGNPAFDQRFQFAGSFVNGVARVKKDGKFALLGKDGKLITKFVFDELGDLTEGLAYAKSEGKFGYVDKAGEWKIKPAFARARSFCEGMALVQRGGQFEYIDKSGKVVHRVKGNRADSYSSGLAAVGSKAKLGYMDKDGKQVIAPKYEVATKFKGSYAAVREKGKFGVIDRSGKYLIKPEFDRVELVTPTFGQVWKGEKVTPFVIRDGIGESSQKVVFQYSGDSRLRQVQLISKPEPAEVYAIPSYDVAGAGDYHSLLDERYRVPEGNTTVTTSLSVMVEYLIVFVRGSKDEKRTCKPGIHPKIEVTFRE